MVCAIAVAVAAVGFWACPVTDVEPRQRGWESAGLRQLVPDLVSVLYLTNSDLNLPKPVNNRNYSVSCPAAVSQDLTKVYPECRDQPSASFLPHLFPSPAFSSWCDLTWPAQSMSTQSETQVPVSWTPNPPPYCHQCSIYTLLSYH